jgi:transcriptional regulator with XRE-family HTH domain
LSASATVLQHAREQAGLTQAELGRCLGVSQSAIAKLEHPRSNPSIEVLDRALRATGHRLELLATACDQTVDESLIRRHLELPPIERLRRVDATYEEARKLAEAGARSRGELA